MDIDIDPSDANDFAICFACKNRRHYTQLMCCHELNCTHQICEDCHEYKGERCDGCGKPYCALHLKKSPFGDDRGFLCADCHAQAVEAQKEEAHATEVEAREETPCPF